MSQLEPELRKVSTQSATDRKRGETVGSTKTRRRPLAVKDDALDLALLRGADRFGEPALGHIKTILAPRDLPKQL
jgi:hypothetical protein